jgi:hypothetical protein
VFNFLVVNAVAASDESELPSSTINFSFPDEATDNFIQAVKQFAEENAFAVRVGHTRPDGKHFLIQMWREDLKVIVLNPSDPGRFRVSFYQNSKHAVSKEFVDNLLQRLENDARRVTGIVFSH